MIRSIPNNILNDVFSVSEASEANNPGKGCTGIPVNGINGTSIVSFSGEFKLNFSYRLDSPQIDNVESFSSSYVSPESTTYTTGFLKSKNDIIHPR
jgi:hypothetical protein